MGISCKPWGKLKSGFDKLDYQTKKQEELFKKKKNSKEKKNEKDS